MLFFLIIMLFSVLFFGISVSHYSLILCFFIFLFYFFHLCLSCFMCVIMILYFTYFGGFSILFIIYLFFFFFFFFFFFVFVFVFKEMKNNCYLEYESLFLDANSPFQIPTGTEGGEGRGVAGPARHR